MAEARTANETLRGARDQLISLRSDHGKAVEMFEWPDLGARFSWAVDFFDAYARGNDTPGLVIVEEDGTSARLTFAELTRRSDQLAVWLSRHGVSKGDRVILMLGNQVELWESMLAVMKLGGVIMPTTTALGSADLADRVSRGGVRHVIAASADLAKFADVPGDYGRIRVGDGPAAWADYREAYAIEDPVIEHPGTAPSDPLLLYFTSGTTSRPKLVEHTQVSYPVGHLSTMYWIGLRPGDVHLNISSPGWAKHAWSCFFAPWIAEATVFVYNYARFDAAALLVQIRRAGVTTFCAPPTVWRMLIQADLSGGPGRAARGGRRRRAAQPRGHRAGQRRLGTHDPRRLRPDRDHRAGRQHPGQPVKPGSMGRPLPGCRSCSSTRSPAQSPRRARSASTCRAPLSLMTGYQGDPERHAEAMRGGYYHTGDVATRDADGYITYVGRTDDVFKASDYKISPFELESVLIEHPAVVEAAVVPAPDPTRGWPCRRPTSCWPPATSPTPRPHCRSSGTPASTWPPTSGSDVSSSPSCPRRSPARSAASSCASASRSAPPTPQPGRVASGATMSSPSCGRADHVALEVLEGHEFCVLRALTPEELQT